MNEHSAGTDDAVLVIDVPQSLSAAEASRVLSEPIARGYYLKAVTAGEPMRAVFTRYRAIVRGTRKAEDDRAAEAKEAVVIIKDQLDQDPAITLRRLVTVLAESGIDRKKDWVHQRVRALKMGVVSV
jgi:hypothetical protein